MRHFNHSSLLPTPEAAKATLIPMPPHLLPYLVQVEAVSATGQLYYLLCTAIPVPAYRNLIGTSELCQVGQDMYRLTFLEKMR